MGRNRKPKELHELTGTDKHNPEQKTFGSSAAIAFPKGTEIKTPDCLRLTRVRNAFQNSAESLIAIRVLTPIDAPSFEIVFRCYEKFLKADDAVNEFEKTMDLSSPEEQNQYKVLLKRQHQFFSEWVQLSARFGFTPADRAKLSIPEEQPKDILEEFLND